VGNRQDMMVTDSGGTKVHVYTYDNMMSLRAKRGNLQVTGVDYPPELSYPSAGSGQVLATDTTFNEACPERSERDAAGNLVTPDPDPGRNQSTHHTIRYSVALLSYIRINSSSSKIQATVTLHRERWLPDEQSGILHIHN